MGDSGHISGADLFRVVALILIMGCIATGLIWKMDRMRQRIEELENAPADTVTITRVDTIRIDTPVPVHHYIRQHDTAFIVLTDVKVDTIKQLVYLPREAMVYKDSTYRAVVSGVQPRLDSIEVYQRTRTETITKTVKVPDRKRWGLGVNVGAGWNGKQVQPFVGVGVQYNIVRW